MEQGWRTIVAGNGERLSLRNECLLAEGETRWEIPLRQIREIVLEYPRGTLSLALLNALRKYHIQVLLCDEKSSPFCELSWFPAHSNAAGRVRAQSRWKDSDRARIWKRIVEDKILMQERLLARLGLDAPDELRLCGRSALPGDSDNREGQAAKLYFHSLFGRDFQRRAEDDLNAALNYGYAVLRSSMTRILTLHGYYPALGIWHHSETNRFNLSCDLMEPFRPVVDEIVWNCQTMEWDKLYRRKLTEVLRKTVRFNDRRMELASALEAYALDVLTAMEDETRKIGEVDFER